MAILSTNYLGLALKSPIVVGSSGLTNTVAKIQTLEKYGAGAIVLKSLFEEQIRLDTSKLIQYGTDSPEAQDYLASYVRSSVIQEYLDYIALCKKSVNIPIIASINCMSPSEWISLAADMERAGADALEINIYYMPIDTKPSSEYEKIYLDIAVQLKKILHIPIVFKIGSNFTNPIYMIDQFYKRGVSAVVLFNRFYATDFDLKTLQVTTSDIFSSSSEMNESLRWVSIASAQIPRIQIAASTGVHSGWDVVKQLLAGATVTEVCSTLYQHGPEHLADMLQEIQSWMRKNEYVSIDDFRGKMNLKNMENPAHLRRSQYMRYIIENQ